MTNPEKESQFRWSGFDFARHYLSLRTKQPSSAIRTIKQFVHRKFQEARLDIQKAKKETSSGTIK